MDQSLYANLPEVLVEALPEIYREGDYGGETVTRLLSLTETFDYDLGRFGDKSFHASGGMKRISRVMDSRTNRIVALAELKPDLLSTQNIAAFLREAKITAALSHPNIVPVYDLGLDSRKQPYFTMKFMKDQSLKKVLRELAKQNPAYTAVYNLKQLLNIFRKVCDAVAYAHACGVVHLDIKPENIMVGEFGEVYLCDWGLAKVLQQSTIEYKDQVVLDPDTFDSITFTGAIKGTPGFMAPEQIDCSLGSKNEQTDIYALGAVLYSILTFRKPFQGVGCDEVLARTLAGQAEEVGANKARLEVAEGLVAIVDKARSLNQQSRYVSVSAFIEDLTAYQEGYVTGAESGSWLKSIFYLFKRHQLQILVLSCLCGLFTLFMGLLFYESHEQEVAAEAEREKLAEALAEKQALMQQQTGVWQQNLGALEARISALSDLTRQKSLNVNFTTDGRFIPMSELGQAGFFRCGYWMNVYKNKIWDASPKQTLIDNSGHYSEVSYRFDSIYNGGSGFRPIHEMNLSGKDFNSELMDNWIYYDKPQTIHLFELNSFSPCYDLVIYTVADSGNTVAEFSVAGRKITNQVEKALTKGFYVTVNMPEQPVVFGKNCNVLIFKYLTADQLSLRIAPKAGRVGIAGFQVVNRTF